MGRGAWRATVHGVTKSWTQLRTKQQLILKHGDYWMNLTQLGESFILFYFWLLQEFKTIEYKD